MAKLTKTEIKALAIDIREKIIEETKIEVREYNNNVLNNFYNTELGQKVKYILDNQDTNSSSLINMTTVNVLAGTKTTCYINVSKIERRLIIEQIECDNVNDLVKKVTNHFIT
jgi:uncharacterized protein (DUF2164 family)